MAADVEATPDKERRALLEGLWVCLRLGVASFGRPIAHLGFFRVEFVGRRKWFDEAA